MSNPPTIGITLRLTPDLHAAVYAERERTGESLNAIIARAIRATLAAHLQAAS